MFILWIDLPNLETFTTGYDSFYETKMVEVNSISSPVYCYSFYIDVPFDNGKYNHGKYAFYRSYSNHFQYDDGMVLTLFFIRIYWIS